MATDFRFDVYDVTPKVPMATDFGRQYMTSRTPEVPMATYFRRKYDVTP